MTYILSLVNREEARGVLRQPIDPTQQGVPGLPLTGFQALPFAADHHRSRADVIHPLRLDRAQSIVDELASRLSRYVSISLRIRNPLRPDEILHERDMILRS